MRTALCRIGGFASLLLVLVLLVSMASVTLLVSRTQIQETTLTANDQFALFMQHSAEAGLDYAVAWAMQHEIPWVQNQLNCGQDPGCPHWPELQINAELPVQLTVQFTRQAVNSRWIKIQVSAKQTDNASQATASCYIQHSPSFKTGCLPGSWQDF